MGSINLLPSNHVEYRLTAEGIPSILIDEPKGWEEDGIEYDRHDVLHGIVTKFTNKLTFYKDAKIYIESALALGVNTPLALTKRELLEVGGEVKFVDRYLLYADYKTLNIKEDDDSITLKFNSNRLAQLVENNEDDEFEIERLTTVDELNIPEYEKYIVKLKGRSIQLNGESVLSDLSDEHRVLEPVASRDFVPINNFFADNALMANASIRTKIITRGNQRHSSVDTELISFEDRNNFNYYFTNDFTSSSAIFVRSDDENDPDEDIRVVIDCSLTAIKDNNPDTQDLATKYKLSLYVLDYDENTGNFSVNTEIELSRNDSIATFYNDSFIFDQDFTLNNNQTLAVIMTYKNLLIEINKYNIKIDTIQQIEESNDLKVTFASDVMSRLMHVISNNNDAFYSKYYGRIEKGYAEDGPGAMTGLISGYWARAFDEASEKYKAPTISLKDARESLTAIDNVGFGIETINFRERLRCEEIDYFYREETVIRIPNQVYNESRKLNPKLYFSSIRTGFSRGGDYEDEQGLDEPNTRTTWVTPLRVGKNEYKQISKVRSDEYGLERLRRLPQSLYPSEDTRGDSDNWFLDLKRSDVDGVFDQKEWYDRLAELPTGIHSPSTYRSSYFTPLRMMLRHAKIFMAGMEEYRDRKISYANAVANSVLSTKFIGETEALRENQDIDISGLDRAILTPWEIKFKCKITNELIDQIEGGTRSLVRGEYEMVPNVYFKIEFMNQKGVLEKGYIKNVKIREEAEFTIIKSNENI